MTTENAGNTEPGAGFEAAWCATDLGEHRPCRYTYEHYAYESLPPLDSARFTGDFAWLGGPGAASPERGAALEALDGALAAHGLALSADFIAFQAGERTHRALDEVSVTACWTSISQPLPCPGEPGAFLVRFLRDQQDCVLWYLCLRPSGETFVVWSPVDFAYEYERGGEGGEGGEGAASGAAELRAEIRWCAPSFEEFAYRFWAENRIWHAVHGSGPAELDRPLRDYLGHYGPIRTSPHTP
ncbi:hypothetical protein [Streptomyces goshikiensis]|uniref:hypothetical protein n=1 Tax=Streptomyces goshikiensis TaxID=1942 RepID=UPI0036B49C3A